MLENIKADYQRYGGRHANVFGLIIKAVADAGFRAVMLYRIGRYCRRHHLRILAAIVERVMHHSCHCWISTAADIGSGFLIAHVGGLVIGGVTRIGKNCDVRQNITFGGNFNKKDSDGRGMPWVGDNVSVGAGAVVVGPVRIGSGAIIGANSVVTHDVPDNTIVSGIPAVVIKPRWDESSGRKL